MGQTSGVCYSGTLKNTYFYVSWWQNSQSIPNNDTSISYEVHLSCNGNYWYSNAVRINSLYINGNYITEGTYSNFYGGDYVLTSGSVTIPHNSDGTKSFNITINGWLYSYGDTSGSSDFTLNDIPRSASISTAPNFNDTENPTITYNNPAGNSISSLQACISLSGGIDIAYRDINKTGSLSYTFNLTEAERNVLRSATTGSTKRNVIFYIKTVIGNNTFYSSKSVEFTVINAIPTLSVTATPNDYSTLTGSATKLIANVSKIAVSGTATALKSSYINLVKCGNINVISSSNSTNPRTFSTSLQTSNLSVSGTTATLSSYTKDLRNVQSSTDTKTFQIVNYIPLTINVTKCMRVNSTSSQLTVQLNGSYFNASFGSQSNTITLNWKYKLKNASTWTNGGTLTPNISGNTWNYSGTIGGSLVYTNAYDILFTVTDKIYGTQSGFSAKTEQKTITKGVPVFDYGVDSNDRNYFNINGDICQNNQPFKNMIYGIIARHNVTISESWANIDVGNISSVTTIGNKLSISNGKIKIGSGVSKIKAYAMSEGVYPNLNGDMTIKVFNFTQNTFVSFGSYYGSSVRSQGIVPFFTSITIASVNENDLIGITINCGGTGTVEVLNCPIYVEVVE